MEKWLVEQDAIHIMSACVELQRDYRKRQTGAHEVDL